MTSRSLNKGTLLGAVAFLLSGCVTDDMVIPPAVLVNNEKIATTDGNAYERGKSYLLAGQYGLALQALRAALHLNPESVNTLNAIAITYDHLGRSDLSLRYFEQALFLNPQSPGTLNNLGRSYMRRGQWNSALSYLQQAVAIAKDDPVIDANLNITLRAMSTATMVSRKDTPYPRPGRHLPALDTTMRIERMTAALQTLVTRAVVDAPEDGQSVERHGLHAASRSAVLIRSSIADQAHSGVPHAAERQTEPERRWTSARIEVSNGAGRRRMATRIGQHLARSGLKVGRLTNADHFNYKTTVISCRPGFETVAKRIMEMLPFSVEITTNRIQSSDVILRLGQDLLGFDQTLPLGRVQA